MCLVLPGMAVAPGPTVWTQMCATAGWSSWHCMCSAVSECERRNLFHFSFYNKKISYVADTMLQQCFLQDEDQQEWKMEDVRITELQDSNLAHLSA